MHTKGHRTIFTNPPISNELNLWVFRYAQYEPLRLRYIWCAGRVFPPAPLSPLTPHKSNRIIYPTRWLSASTSNERQNRRHNMCVSIETRILIYICYNRAMAREEVRVRAESSTLHIYVYSKRYLVLYLCAYICLTKCIWTEWQVRTITRMPFATSIHHSNNRDRYVARIIHIFVCDPEGMHVCVCV